MRKSNWDKVRGRVCARVRWDEKNLVEIEANKPQRQKITEPKTPYHAPQYSDGSMSPISDIETLLDDAEHAEAVSSALNEAESSSGKQTRQGMGWTSSEDEEDATEHDEEDTKSSGKKMSFQEHRRAHYDEFQKVKELLSQDSMSGEEDEEDEKEKSASDQANGHDFEVI